MTNSVSPFIKSKELRSKLSELENLKQGWAGDGAGQPVSIAASALAYGLLTNLQIVPTIGGGIQIESHVGGWDVELIVSPEGKIESHVFKESLSCDWNNK